MLRFVTIGLTLLALLLAGCGDGGGTPDEPEVNVSAVKTPIPEYDRGLDFLLAAAPEGNFVDPGLTALAASTFQMRPGGVRESDAEFLSGLLEFIAGFQKANGGIYDMAVANYTTSCAVMALTASGDEKYEETVAKAAAFLKTLQTEGGGIGYSDRNPGQPDLSNTQFAIEALRKAGVKADDPVVSETLKFLQSVQNRSESNDTEYKLEDGTIVAVMDDGGAFYKPGESKAGIENLPDGRVGLRSYGSMTYALLKCYLLAGLDKDDPRVAAAVKWIRTHFTLEENPGFQNPEDPNASVQGLYYYYFTLAKALDLLGVDMVEDADGIEHDWKVELREKLFSLQREDGSWLNEKSERWMEGNPVLATSYALAALSYVAD